MFLIKPILSLAFIVLLGSLPATAQITSEHRADELVFKEGIINKALLNYDGTDFTIRNQEFTVNGTTNINLESVNGHINFIAGNELRGRFQEEGGLRLYAPNNGSFLIDVENDGDLKFIGDGGAVVMDLNDTNGRVGIGTSNSTALLDVNGTVRVREIPATSSSTAQRLYVDDNGIISVFVPTLDGDDPEQLQQESGEKAAQLQTLEKRVAELENLLTQLQNNLTKTSSTPSAVNYLLQSVPNPHNGRTTIQYDLPNEIAHYQLQVVNSQGQNVRLLTLDRSKSVNLSGLTTGTYHYTLLQNGQPLRTKTMVVR